MWLKKMQIEHLDKQTVDGAQLNLDALYQIAPSCFTEAADPKTGKIKRMVNFDVLRQLLGDDAVEDALIYEPWYNKGTVLLLSAGW